MAENSSIDAQLNDDIERVTHEAQELLKRLIDHPGLTPQCCKELSESKGIQQILKSKSGTLEK